MALFDKLPSESTPFPLDRRVAWLRMAAMTFDLVCGVEEPIAIDEKQPVRLSPAGHPISDRVEFLPDSPPRAKAAPKDPANLPRPRGPDQMFVIDLDGVAWGRDKPLALSAVGQGDPIWDFRPGEQGIENVIWAEPVNGKVPPLTIFKA
jgi:hypothetical protein